jgi:hypothetical protein
VIEYLFESRPHGELDEPWNASFGEVHVVIHADAASIRCVCDGGGAPRGHTLHVHTNEDEALLRSRAST